MLRKVGDTINNNIESLDNKTIPKTVNKIQTQHEIKIIIITIAAAGVPWMLFRSICNTKGVTKYFIYDSTFFTYPLIFSMFTNSFTSTFFTIVLMFFMLTYLRTATLFTMRFLCFVCTYL